MESESRATERVLGLVHRPRDIDRLHKVLTHAALAHKLCTSTATMVQEMARGAGLLLLRQETLTESARAEIGAALAAQPAWSAIPIIVLGRAPQQAQIEQRLRAEWPSCSVEVLPYPVAVTTLMRAVRRALWERRRQYELRAHLLEREQLLAALSETHACIQSQQAELDLLASASHTLLATSLDYATTLENIATVAVPLLGDIVTIHVRTPHGMRQRAAACYDPARRPLVEALGRYEIPIISADAEAELTPIQRLYQQGVPLLLPAVTDEILQGMAQDAEHLHLLRALGIRSLLALPLQAEGWSLGILTIYSYHPTRRYGARERRLLERLATRAALAVRNATLHRATRRQLVVSREAERSTLARTLHDGIVQELIGLQFQIYHLRRHEQRQFASLPRRNGEPPPLATMLDTLESGMIAVIEKARTLISELRPAGLEEFGLLPAIEGWVAQAVRTAGPQAPTVRLDLEPLAAPLALPISLCLFRVQQEALRNALAHGAATEVMLRLWADQEAVHLHIIDDGQGFRAPPTLDEFALTEHYGLRMIADQVDALEGTFELRTAPGAGTQIRVWIPLVDLGESHL